MLNEFEEYDRIYNFEIVYLLTGYGKSFSLNNF